MIFSKFYGGRTPSEVAEVARGLASEGLASAIALLPRFELTRGGILWERDRILEVLPAVQARKASADLTVKLSQLGLRWDPQACRETLEGIAFEARAYGSFVWVDMEQSSQVDATLRVFREAARGHENLGICLQTYLKRTEADADALLKEGHPLRLVKGYYREWPPTSWATWRETTECFARLIPELLAKSRRPAVGTHDEALIRRALEASRDLGGKPFEIQMFLGARMDLARRLAKEGHQVRIYIPYGPILPYLIHSLPYMDFTRNVERMLGLKRIV